MERLGYAGRTGRPASIKELLAEGRKGFPRWIVIYFIGFTVGEIIVRVRPPDFADIFSIDGLPFMLWSVGGVGVAGFLSAKLGLWKD